VIETGRLDRGGCPRSGCLCPAAPGRVRRVSCLSYAFSHARGLDRSRRGSVASRSRLARSRGQMHGSPAEGRVTWSSRSAIAGHRKRRHTTFDQRFRQLLPCVACRLVEAFDRVRLRGPAMTYSSWGNACGLCSTRSGRCLQCRLGHGIGNSRVNLGRLGFLAEIDESSRAKE
jgi:hypothetical protein